jgi:hypothetical protein
MKRVAMVGIISNPVKSLNSHNGGWTLVCKNIIESFFKSEVDILTEKNDWGTYDVLVINEGVNYKEGSYNFFGGVQESVKLRLMKLNSFKGDVFCINEPVDYNDVCAKRKELKEFVGFKFKIPNVFYTDKVSEKMILGDSHSISVYKPGYSISRNDGKTLYGFLKKGLNKHVKNHKELVFYAGNIDLRFHFCRLNADLQGIVNDLKNQLLGLNLEKVTIVQLLPIEDTSRIIPKTGMYKGKSFYGTLEERKQKRNEINNLLEKMCRECGFEFLKWNLGDDLSFDDMESRQSVHLRPKSYMFSNELIELKQKTLF